MNENLHDRMHPNNIDDLFKSAIDPYEETPSSELWQSVEKDLDRYGIIQIKGKYNNLKKLAIASVLLLSSAVAYELLVQHNAYRNGSIVENDVTNSKLSIDPGEQPAMLGKQKSSFPLQGLKEIAKELRPYSASRRPGPFSDATTLLPSKSEKDVTAYTLLPGKAIGVKNASGLIMNPASTSGSDANTLMGPSSGQGTQDRQELSLTSKSPSLTYQLPLTETVAMKSGNPALITHPVSLNESLSPSQVIKPVLPATKRSLFSFALIFSPDLTARRVNADWPINREDNKDEIRKSERYAFSYSFGALIDYNINRRWAIQSGFTLSRAVINIQPKFIFARPDNLGDMKYKFNSSSGYSFISSKLVSPRPVFGDSVHALGSSSSLQYVSVPLAVKYKLGRKRLNFYGEAGAAANILIKDKIETRLVTGGNHPESAVNRDIRGLKPVYYSALVAAGAEYNFNKTLAVNFTPTARFALTSINKDAPVKSYQRSLGLVAGVQVNF